jgi:Peroxidase, family 2
MGFFSPITRLFYSVYVFTWDTGLVFCNLISPNKPPGQIVPEDHPGSGGKWPEYVPAEEGDSRCACPALNAMANHGEHAVARFILSITMTDLIIQGIISHDGRGISFGELTTKVGATYNLSPTFAVFLSSYIANFMKKDYNKDKFDLKDIDQHNQIEHDGSLLRKICSHINYPTN